MTVYIEQILAVNFLTGGVLLWITGRLWGRAMSGWRWGCASLLAALWATAATLPACGPLAASWCWLPGLAAVTALCFRPSGWRVFFRLWGTLTGVTLVAGGAAMALYFRAGKSYALACTPAGLAVMAAAARFVLPGRYSFLRRFEAVIGGPEAPVPALIDSGNRLVEPISGLPVIVAGGDAAAMLAGSPVDAEHGPVRWIPCATVAGGRAMPAVLCRNIRVKRSGVWTELGPIYVAVTDGRLPEGVSALVPPLPHFWDNGRMKWHHCA